MACIYPSLSSAPEELYPYLLDQIKALIQPEDDWVANAANAAAAIGFIAKDLNWAGFYLLNAESLVLGPFWGKPAVTRIAMGSGVCGLSAQSKKTIVVPDVHQFPGHISCDLYSNSEIVLPLIQNDTLIGVLDIDSPELNRFNEIDQMYFEKIAAYLSKSIKWPVK